MKTLDKVSFFLIQGTLIIEYQGKSTTFHNAPLEVMDLVSADLHHNPEAIKALEQKGIHDPMKQLHQFAVCRYVGCEKEECTFRGRICADPFNSIVLDRFSSFELDIIRKFAQGTTPEAIAMLMNTSYSNVRRIIARTKHKLNISTHAGLGSWAAKMNLV